MLLQFIDLLIEAENFLIKISGMTKSHFRMYGFSLYSNDLSKTLVEFIEDLGNSIERIEDLYTEFEIENIDHDESIFKRVIKISLAQIRLSEMMDQMYESREDTKLNIDNNTAIVSIIWNENIRDLN